MGIWRALRTFTASTADEFGADNQDQYTCHAKFRALAQVNNSSEMSQTNRQLSRHSVRLGVERRQTGGGVSAPSMAQILEEIFFPQQPAGNCADRLRNGAEEQVTYGSGRALCDMEKRCCQAAAAAQEELTADSRVGDSRSFPACATISETARELCKAVSVSLGLAMESSDAGDMETALQACSANDRDRGDCLLGVSAVPVKFPGARAIEAAEYQDERLQPGQKQPVELFKSSDAAAPPHQRTLSHTSADDRKFTLCNADDLATEEIDPLGSVRAASCAYAHSAQINLAHFGHVPERLYKPPDEPRDTAEAMESKFGGYEPQHYGVKIKSEVPGTAGVLLGSNFTFNEKYNPEYWDGRQCISAHSNGASDALCYPYDRSAVRHEQWYYGGMAKIPYPNSSYMKSEVPYTDPR